MSELLSRRRIGLRFKRILDDVLLERRSEKGSGVFSAFPLRPAARGDAGRKRHPTPFPSPKVKVAIVSLLFNWPSTGGGIIHTVETGKFLRRAGFEVRHVYACYPAWGIGRVEGDLSVPHEALDFDEDHWNAADIQNRFRRAIDQFSPDYVIVADSWNFKPLLAEALGDYPCFLRLAAMECLCPLNNVRMLPGRNGEVTQCPRHQLATPEICRDCVARNGASSGRLHQLERSLSGFGTAEYTGKLRRTFETAEGVLVVNPFIGSMLGPYANQVHVVPSGFDPARFPWPPPHGEGPAPEAGDRCRIFFAGLVQELMKGYHVLERACSMLWQKRQDFELVATAEPTGRVNAFTRFVGWLSQEELPRQLRAADVLVFPTVAEEGLGRSVVEAMAVGRPVIASRIGGLQTTVVDGYTGLLFEPGNAEDLAAKLARLLDDPELRRRLGLAGRERFEEHFTWDVIIEQHYRPLFMSRRKTGEEQRYSGAGLKCPHTSFNGKP